MQVLAGWVRVIRFGVRGIFAFLCGLFPGILLFSSIPSGASQESPKTNSKNVLVVFNTFERDHKPLELIESAVRARVRGQVNFYTEFMDYQRFDSDQTYRDWLAETIRREYRQTKLDVVIAGGIEALQLATQYRERVFPGVPIVFFGLSASELKEAKLVPEMTGVTTSPGLRETIDLALRLDPDTTAVAVIDAGPLFWWRVAHAELLRHQDKVREIDILGPPSPQMLERVAALPPHTLILFQLAPASSVEPAVTAYDVLDAAAQHLPTYSAWPTLCWNHGCIGGAYYTREKDDLLAGDMAGRVLAGDRAENIPIADTTNVQVQVDWRALQKWHIPESSLPAGSAILYRPPTLWEQYRSYVIATISVIAALLLLIVWLLWERARKRKAEAVLRESEERFRTMADNTPSLIWMCDRRGKITYLNSGLQEFYGPDSDLYGDSWINYVHPDDVNRVLQISSLALEARRAISKQFRVRRWDGVYRWLFDVASPRLNGDGSFAGYIGSAIDVTDQKLARQALEKVSGQLIEAQEKERRRIARDLHDDICQRLALLSMELDQANRSVNASDEPTKQRLREIRQHCAEIAGDVQSLSHELHSSRLDYLGIVAAIGGFCHEFSKQHEVSVEFTDRDVPAELPRDISLCLFRIAQEALHNAMKYSGVNEYQVELTATAKEVQLVVSDLGRGFDVEAAEENRGLGLVSMQERVHLVHGSLHVESAAEKGTKILAVVPLVGERQESPEDGGIEEPEGVAGAA